MTPRLRLGNRLTCLSCGFAYILDLESASVCARNSWYNDTTWCGYLLRFLSPDVLSFIYAVASDVDYAQSGQTLRLQTRRISHQLPVSSITENNSLAHSYEDTYIRHIYIIGSGFLSFRLPYYPPWNIILGTF